MIALGAFEGVPLLRRVKGLSGMPPLDGGKRAADSAESEESTESGGTATAGNSASPGDLDAIFVQSAASGDLAAFEELYRRHAPRIHALCRRMTGDPALADDLLQESFLSVWQHLPRFEGRSRFSTWLHQIAIRTVFDSGRRESRRPRLVDAPELASFARETAAPRAGDVNPGGAAPVSGGLRLELERAIERLPEAARRVLVLHDIHGYAHEEIAGMGGISVGTSKSQLHRARMLLREALR